MIISYTMQENTISLVCFDLEHFYFAQGRNITFWRKKLTYECQMESQKCDVYMSGDSDRVNCGPPTLSLVLTRAVVFMNISNPFELIMNYSNNSWIIQWIIHSRFQLEILSNQKLIIQQWLKYISQLILYDIVTYT